MSRQLTFAGLLSATFSPVSESGPIPCALPVGLTNAQSGPGPALASRSASQASEPAHPTSATCGPRGSGSSASADQTSSSGNKSPMPSENLDLRKCENCGRDKPLCDFSKTGYEGSHRNICKTCRNVYARDWDKKRRTSTVARAGRLVSGAKSRAMERGMPFDLDVQWALEKLDKGTCEATGIPFDMNATRDWNTPSLDRIVPHLGYTKTNTRMVLFAVNAACGSWGEGRMMEVASSILRKRQERSISLSKRLGEILKRNLENRGSKLFKLTWKTRATPLGRQICELRASGLRTSGSDCTGWASPMRRDADRGGVAMALRPSGTGASSVDQSLLAGWPTPDAHPDAPNSSTNRGKDYGGSRARMTVQGLGNVAHLAPWPTPRREDSESTGAHRGTPDTLHSASQLAGWSTPRANKWGFPDAHGSHETPLAPWPTPMAGSPATETYNEAGDTCNSRKTRLLVSGETPNGSPVPTEKRGRLNPSMSRWLMGLPVEWDLCAPKTTRTTRR